MTKKTMIIKSSQDVSMFTDDYLEIMKEALRLSVQASGVTLEIEIRTEDAEERAPDDALVERLLQSVRAEFKANDAPAAKENNEQP